MYHEVNVLVVDDEQSIREIIVDGIHDTVRRVYEAANGLEALSIIQNHDIDIVFSDVRMPEMGGVELLQKIRENGLDTVFILVTAYSDKDVATNALHYGAYDIIEKPFKIAELRATLERAAVKTAYERENQRLVDEFIQSKVGGQSIDTLDPEELAKLKAISKSILELRRIKYARANKKTNS